MKTTNKLFEAIFSEAEEDTFNMAQQHINTATDEIKAAWTVIKEHKGGNLKDPDSVVEALEESYKAIRQAWAKL
jgi:hypothetical protein